MNFDDTRLSLRGGGWGFPLATMNVAPWYFHRKREEKKNQTGLLIFRAVADSRNSGISAKSRKIPQKTRNTAKSARNISKYMSAKHI